MALQRAPCGSMLETLEPHVHLGDHPSQAFEQLGRMWTDIGEECAVDPGEQTDEMRFSFAARRLENLGAVGGGKNTRYGDTRSPFGEPLEREVLELEDGALLAGVRDLEHGAPAVGEADEEILIALARQRADVPRPAEPPGENLLRLRRGKRGLPKRDAEGHTVQIATAPRSAVSGSPVGSNSWATNPAKPRSASAFATAW